jgi:hypothetical protein
LKFVSGIVVAVIAVVWTFSEGVGAYQPFVSQSGKPYVWALDGRPERAIFWMPGPGVPDMALDAMASGFQAWRDATGGQFNYAMGTGEITIDWDTDGSKIGDPLYLAYTTFLADLSGHIVGAHIIVNAHNYTWHRGGFGGVALPEQSGIRDANLDTVILHELGHALGLDHSDKNLSALVGPVMAGDPPTMNATIYPNSGTLHNDDIAGIRSLYPNASGSAPSTISVTATPPSGKRAPFDVILTQHGGDGTTHWDFGDGTSTDGWYAFHRFTAKGLYTVSATAHGVTATTTVQVGNVKRAPKAVKKPVKKKPQ